MIAVEKPTTTQMLTEDIEEEAEAVEPMASSRSPA
eukprot:CAMPEP_0170491810 /NCGR_PEP_ID=MMETSP0208-20121228/11269_1 /TAXON_ID=197538 /ORGANISM="Strombidium inclinatum, Strain S3" /LENGTH=34 /DNA_ID= /DNA_START= /DNA_END= /DNA_ORIENTATION=